MIQQTKRPYSKLLVWVCGIYLVPVIVAVLYTWFWERYPLDLSLTVSLYVARYPWTTVLFFVHVLAVCILILLYLRTVKLKRIQRILYHLVLLCILGCAVFPCNRSRSVIATRIHDLLSYVLVIAASVTFVGMLVFARQARQRNFAAGSLIFMIAFIIGFSAKFSLVKNAVFIWENMILLLFLIELFLEKYNTDDCCKEDKTSEKNDTLSIK